MRTPSLAALLLSGLLLPALLPARPALAAPTVEERLRALEETVRRQEAEIERLRGELAARRASDDALGAELDRLLAKAEDEPFWQQPGTLRAFWKDGLRLESADRSVEVRLGGRIDLDGAWFDEDFHRVPLAPAKRIARDTRLENAVETRRARLTVSGRIWRRTVFKADYDFAGGDADFKDLYLGLVEVPCAGEVLVGHVKEPFSLDQANSTTATTFLERGLTDALAPARNVGVRAANTFADDRLFVSFGVFHDTDDQGNGTTDRSATLRVVGWPVFEEDGSLLVHVGGAVSLRRTADDVFRVEYRPGSHAPSERALDTGEFAADRELLWGLELAAVWGALHAQLDVVRAAFDSREADDPRFSGWTASVGFFVTGERRPYRRDGAVFGPVKPSSHVNDPDRPGPGALELAIRFSSIDLVSGAVNGGEADELALGVNWYLNPNLRVMLNWVLLHLRGVGDLDVFAVRFQVHF